MPKLRVTDILKELLLKANITLGEKIKSDVIFINSPITNGLDDIVRQVIEELHDDPAQRTINSDTSQRLSVLLETKGGSVEIVERLYEIFRFHYDEVYFIIPDYAYSAGTILALSGDKIFMDYYSVLGPIDPQIENENGSLVPGMSYNAEYERLMRKINDSPNNSDAEMAYLLRKFDTGTLFTIKQNFEYSKSLLKKWLPKHKFKSWEFTETSQQPVTDKMKIDRANEIATKLGNPDNWHSHGRGIHLNELTSENIKLKIIDYSKIDDLSKAIREYEQIFKETCAITYARSAIHSRCGLYKMAS